MERGDFVGLATRAMFGDATAEDLRTLDDEIRRASRITGRSVPDTADLLRNEALAGPYYRGKVYDQ